MAPPNGTPSTTAEPSQDADVAAATGEVAC